MKIIVPIIIIFISFIGFSKNIELEQSEAMQVIENEECLPVELVSPLKRANLNLLKKERINFEWKEKNEARRDYYELILLDKEKNEIYKQRTKRNNIEHNEKLEKLYQSYFGEETKILYWRVESFSKECGITKSKTQSIIGSLRDVGLVTEFTEVTCKSPAFDSLGSMHYTAKLCIENPATNNGGHVIPAQTFSVTDINGNNSSIATQIPDPNSIPYGSMILFPVTLAPGQNLCFYVEFSRPIGEQQAVFYFEHYEQGFPNLVTSERPRAMLPSCICSVCDDLQIISSNEIIWPLNGKIRIRNDFQILNSPNIQQVNAEIIRVQHEVNDEQCYTCTKEEHEMGLFSNEPSSGRTIGMNGWLNQGKADLSDANGDGYGNQFIWKAQNTTGVNFGVNRQFFMNLNFPKQSSLDCCNTTYKVCIRYSFTDINCQTCDTVVCYEFNSSDSTSGGTGTGTGSGSGTGTIPDFGTSPDIGIPIDITPKILNPKN